MNRYSTPTKAAALASALNAPGAAAARPQPAAHEARRQANPFAGSHHQALAKSPEPNGGAVKSANASTVYGPPTTSRPDGAGGPLNRWDREIAHWRAMGKPKLAADLQLARARLAITFELLEPVFVPTDGQRLLYGLRACPMGLRTMEAR